MQRYTDDFFITKLQETGDSSVYGIAKKYKLHHNTVRDRLRNLYDRGLINKICANPEIYGPVKDEKPQIKEASPEQKKKFFAEMVDSKSELTTIESEILEIIERGKEKEECVSKLSELLGYHRSTIGRATKSLEEKGYLSSKRRGNHIFYFRNWNNRQISQNKNQEITTMLSVDSLLSTIKNSVTDLEAQVKILSLQNEVFKNVTKNAHFENRTIINEESIREDERQKVLNSLSKILGIGIQILSNWYKMGLSK